MSAYGKAEPAKLKEITCPECGCTTSYDMGKAWYVCTNCLRTVKEEDRPSARSKNSR